MSAGGSILNEGVEALTVGEVALVGNTSGRAPGGVFEPKLNFRCSDRRASWPSSQGTEARAAKDMGASGDFGDGGGVEGGVGVVGGALG